MRFRIFSVLLIALAAVPASAQVTHLGIPASQMVSVTFVSTAQDVPGQQSGIWIFTSSSNTSPTYYEVPKGFTLVITDLDVQVNSGTTSPVGSPGELLVANAGFPNQAHTLTRFEPRVTLHSPPVLIKATAHIHFTAGFAFPAGSTPVVLAPVPAPDVRVFALASGYLTQ